MDSTCSRTSKMSVWALLLMHAGTNLSWTGSFGQVDSVLNLFTEEDILLENELLPSCFPNPIENARRMLLPLAAMNDRLESEE